MAEAAFVARLALAGILALSGLAKLADLPGTRAAVRDFGVPERAARLAVALPPLELALAAMLLVPAVARPNAFAAAALLAIFTLAVAVSLARGRRPNCRCFGALSGEAIGPRTLARNAVFVAIAGLATYDGAAPPAFLGETSVSAGWLVLATLVLGGAVAGLAWLLFALWRQQATLLLRLEALEAAAPAPASDAAAAASPVATPTRGLAIGAPAPDLEVTTPAGDALRLSRHWLHGKPALLILSDPACGACKMLYPEALRWRLEHADRLEVVVLARQGKGTTTPPGLPYLVELRHDEATEAFGAAGTPSAVLVRPDGTIGSTLAEGADAIRELVRLTTGTWQVPLTPRAPRPEAAAQSV